MADRVRGTVNGRELRCHHCGGREFDHKTAALDRLALGGLLHLEGTWGHAAAIYVCAGCGFAHFFMPVPDVRHQFRKTPAAESPSEKPAAKPRPKKPLPEEACLSCGRPIPADADVCAACGWSWQAGEGEGR